jgi:hypothetical protein
MTEMDRVDNIPTGALTDEQMLDRGLAYDSTNMLHSITFKRILKRSEGHELNATSIVQPGKNLNPAQSRWTVSAISPAELGHNKGNSLSLSHHSTS